MERHGELVLEADVIMWVEGMSAATITKWNYNHPGFLEIDLLAHCGDSTDGFYLNTLSAVDVANR